MGDFFKEFVYAKEDVIAFPHGIPGFEKNREFVIVQIPDFSPFEWFVCVDGTRLRFAVINPLLFCPTYAPKFAKEQLDDLFIQKPEDVLLYSIVTIAQNPLLSTANLIGPVLINKTKKIGNQIILDDDRYSTQEPILRNK